MTEEEPTEPVYPFSAPGADIPIFAGDLTIGDARGTGRVWMHMTGQVDLRWELDPQAGHFWALDDARMTFEHPQLGPVDIPVRVSSSQGRGTVLPTSVGSTLTLDEVVVHWVNFPNVYPSDAITFNGSTWSGRWTALGGGWSLMLEARRDLSDAEAEAKGSPFHIITHMGVLRRTDGQSFTPDQVEDCLHSFQVALSLAVGRWVAPALAVGFADGSRVWELWVPWRCDFLRGSEAWWDTHQGDDLRVFISLFLDAWKDPDRNDRTRHLAHHLIESNEAAMTLEARIMLVGAALEYLSWVKFVLHGRRGAKAHSARTAAQNLRELLEEAGIPATVPADLAVVEQLRVERLRQDGPEAVAWVRNRLVHPKNVKEPYHLEHLVFQTWELLMQYGELLLLREVEYHGSYCPRFPPGRWAHNSQPVPWAAPSPPPPTLG